MTRLRWRYAWRNLWTQKTRTAAVILAIAVGVFAFGLIAGAASILVTELPVKYQSIHPASVILHTNAVNDDLIDAVARMPAVATAEGRVAAPVRYWKERDGWRDMKLFALDSYASQEIDIVRPVHGAWPPPDRELLIERISLPLTGAEIGDALLIETEQGQQRVLPIAGVTHDMNQPPAQITGIPNVYVERETLGWLDLPRDFNQIHIVVAEDRFDKAHVETVAHEAVDKIERNGYRVLWTEVPEPGEHWAVDFMPTIILILAFLGVLALVLSALLVINVITAILTQQTRQIGVMKALGARTDQVRNLYLAMVITLGGLALLMAIPLGALAGQGFASFIAGQLNFDLVGLKLSPWVIGLELVVGVGVPVLAALYPISRTARITVREAVQDQGLESGGTRDSHVQRMLHTVQSRVGMPRPIALSMRNTFRRRGRLIRTLIPLMLAGAVFMTVVIARASLFRTLGETLLSQGFHVQFVLEKPERIERLEQTGAELDGISALESWRTQEGALVRADETESDNLVVYALPPETQIFAPKIIAGRWLEADDKNALVVPVGLLSAEPDVALHDTITLKLGGRESDWEIVGIHQAFQPPIAPSVLYTSRASFAREYGNHGHANVMRIVTEEHDAQTHQRIAGAVEARLNTASIGIKSMRTATEDRVVFTERFNIVTVILSSMAALLAIVGALGLMATMSINVLERRREIGVIRAIGASNRAVLRLFVVEGVVIGVISWVGALILSQPMSRFLAWRVGMTMLKLPLTYVYNPAAPVLWLFIVVIVAALASMLPARAATRLSVRETIAYE